MKHLIITGPLYALLPSSEVCGRQQALDRALFRSYTGHRMQCGILPRRAWRLCRDGRIRWGKSCLPYAGSESLLEALRNPARVNVGREATQRVRRGGRNLRADQAATRLWLIGSSRLTFVPVESARRHPTESAQPLLARQAAVTARIQPDSHTAPAMFEGSGANEFVLVRRPGEKLGRAGAAAFSRSHLRPRSTGDQRRKWALGIGQTHCRSRESADRARDCESRVWHHLFGHGIVPSVDNSQGASQPAVASGITRSAGRAF